jgi:hypothetical protein
MMTSSVGIRRWFRAIVIAGSVLGCSAKRPSALKASISAATISNGLAQNGLTINGLAQNGLAQNGLAQNGLAQNGLAQNGLAQNGLAQNGLVIEYKLFDNAVWQAGLTGVAAVPGDILRGNANLRHLLRYLYSCAMPASSATTLDPNNGALQCAPGMDCPDGYTCSSETSQGTCAIPLAGDLGVGINADGTSWQEAGSCDESCQRWVTACVLARTNAYGVHVEVSMRAPANTPPGRTAQFNRIRSALQTSADERQQFNIREGAYYGNLFAGTSGTLDSTGKFLPGTPPNDVDVMTPVFTACAGPGSNIPELTKRFCSSQGDKVVVNVPGLCITDDAVSPPTPGACLEADPTPQDNPTSDGAIGDCFTTTDPNQQTAANEYQEVITVYLQQPVAACGNSVCEKGEDDPTNPLCFSSPQEPCYCPSDCPAGWAKSISPNIAGTFTDDNWQSSSNVRSQYDLSAVGGTDDSVAVAGMSTTSTGDAGLGGAVSGQGFAVLAKYASDGTYQWGRRFGNLSQTDTGGQLQQVTGLAVAPSGNITVVGTSIETVVDPVTITQSWNEIWVSSYSPSGSLLWQQSFVVGSTSTSQVTPTTPIAVDSTGSVIMGGVYSVVSDTGFVGNTVFVSCGGGACSYFIKVAPYMSSSGTLGGQIVWSETAAETGSGPTSVSVGPLDEFVTLDPRGALTKRYSDGSVYPGMWPVTPASPENEVYGDFTDTNKSMPWDGAEVTGIDSTGSVYLAGNSGGFGTGGPGVTPTHGMNPMLIKYDTNGGYQWFVKPSGACGAGCPGGLYDVHNRNISFTHDPLTGVEEVIVGGIGHSYPGGGVDFGIGPVLPTYSAIDIYVAGYKLDKTPLWVRQFPTIPTSGLLSMALDSQGRVVVGGTFGGSMLLNDRLLVTNIPEDPAVLSSFIGSLSTPSTSKNIAPFIGGGNSDSAGNTMSTVPQPIFALATSAQGSEIFYMPPTAIEDGNPGVTVSCFPAPNTIFPIGTTAVTCTAFDPAGNASTASFNVTVADLLGPVFSPVADITVPATSANGTVVSYTLPTAVDQVDGTVGVKCFPAPGTLFGVGKTPVTCSASDNSSNSSSVSFSVTVTASPVGVTCLGTAAMPVIVQTAPGTCGAAVSAASVGTCAGGTAGLLSCLLDGVPTETLGPGTHTVSLVSTGLDGSTASCTSYVTVQDAQKPAITCSGQTVACTGNGGATVTPTATCTDNCSCTAGCITGTFPVGTSLGSCTATDPSGNSAACQPSITVVDTVAPTTTATTRASGTPNRLITINVTSYSVTPSGGGKVIAGSATCWSTAGVAVTLTATDSCALKQLTYALSGAQTGGATVPSSASFTVTKNGTTTVTYGATDIAGNVETAKRLPIFVGGLLGFGISCAPSPSLTGLPAHGTVSLKGTVTLTDSKTGRQTLQSFSFSFSY